MSETKQTDRLTYREPQPTDAEAEFVAWGRAVLTLVSAQVGYLSILPHYASQQQTGYPTHLTATSTQWWALRLSMPQEPGAYPTIRAGFVDHEGVEYFPASVAEVTIKLNRRYSNKALATRIIRDVVRVIEARVPAFQKQQEQRRKRDRLLLAARDMLTDAGAVTSSSSHFSPLHINPEAADGESYGLLTPNWETGNIKASLYNLSTLAVHQLTGYLLDSQGQVNLKVDQASGKHTMELHEVSLSVAIVVTKAVTVQK